MGIKRVYRGASWRYLAVIDMANELARGNLGSTRAKASIALARIYWHAFIYYGGWALPRSISDETVAGRPYAWDIRP